MKTHRWVTCKKCGDECQVDGEYPKFFAWCERCNDYATYDMDCYSADWYADQIEAAEHLNEIRLELRYDD